MNKQQKICLLTIGLCTALTTSVLADGAPTSQFGFSGWPYRQSSGCTGGSVQATATCTAAATPTPSPVITKAPVITEKPIETLAPSWDATEKPTQAPDITLEPTATLKPTETAKPTVAVTPLPTAAPAATALPTAAPTATKAPQSTEKPVETTPVPSTGDDYTTGSVTAQEENAFLLLNADRAANGRSALRLDPELCALARLKSCDMNQNHYFAHTSPTLGSAAEMLRSHGYAFNAVGENIAHHATVEKAQAAFMSSTGHRTNILGAQWTKVGVGVCVDSQGFVYVTQLFVR